MLDSLRSASRSWVAKLLLGLLVLSFAAWGISGQMFTGMGRDVVSAGGTSVSVLEYRLAYDRQLSALSQRFGNRVTREQAQALGVDNQVLSQVMAGAVLDEQAREMGLGVSQDKLAELTASDPAFRGADGSFNRRQFDYVLSQVGMQPEDYIKSREQAAIRQQIVEAVSDGLRVPDTLLRAVALYRNEGRTVEYVSLPPSLVEPIEDPSEETLETWFEERKPEYAAPEYRTISFIKLEPEDIADPSVVSDDQVREYYEENKDNYTTPEERTIEQIVFDDMEAARTAYESIRSGSTFEDLVEAQGKTLEDVRLGTVTQEDVADPAVAEAAFALRENAVSEVVEGSFGPVLLRVTDVQPAETRPLEAVEEEIRDQLALDEANELLLDVHDSYEDARAGGDSLQAAADRLELNVRSVTVDRNSRRRDGTLVDDLPASSELLREAFETGAGVENPPITSDVNGFLFYEVDEIIETRERPLDEVRDEVVSDWKDAQVNQRLSARAADYEEQLDNGESLESIASAAGVETEAERGLTRQANSSDLGTAGIEAVFSVSQGGTGVFAAPDGEAQILFKVTEVMEPVGAGPDMVPEDVRESLASGLSNDLLDQLVEHLHNRYEVTVNRSAVEQALSF